MSRDAPSLNDLYGPGAEEADAAADSTCVECEEAFSERNTFTEAGWKETKIGGLCEICFDLITKEEDEEGDDDGPAF